MKRFSSICGRKKGFKASSSSTPPIIMSQWFFSEDSNEQPPPQPAPSPPQPEDEDKSEDQRPNPPQRDYFFSGKFEDHVFEPLPYSIYSGGGYIRPASPMEKNVEGPWKRVLTTQKTHGMLRWMDLNKYFRKVMVVLLELFGLFASVSSRGDMSGFRAFKAQVPIEWIQSLYITLVRGLPGIRKLHRRTLEARGLRRCHRTVLHSNTSPSRGMINQVKRMVAVETEEMYKARKEAEANHKSRPLLVVTHSSPATGSSSMS